MICYAMLCYDKIFIYYIILRAEKSYDIEEIKGTDFFKGIYYPYLKFLGKRPKKKYICKSYNKSYFLQS